MPAEQAYPAHRALPRAAGGCPCIAGLPSGEIGPLALPVFDPLCTDDQAVTLLRTTREVSWLLVRWLDEIEEFRGDKEHVPGRLNPAVPLSRREIPVPCRWKCPLDGSLPADASPTVSPVVRVDAGSGRGDYWAFQPQGVARGWSPF